LRVLSDGTRRKRRDRQRLTGNLEEREHPSTLQVASKFFRRKEYRAIPPRGSAERIDPPKRAPKTKDWFERAKVVVVAARDRAVETTQQQAAPSMKRPPMLQRRRMAHARKRGLADLKRIAPQVVAVQLDQVEGV
jgi:hypothetical protein